MRLLIFIVAYGLCCVAASAQDTRPAELAGANRNLDNTYHFIMKRLSPEHQTSLRAAQRLWIQFRDLDCAVTEGDLQGCLIQRTDEREKQLRDTYYFDANAKPIVVPAPHD